MSQTDMDGLNSPTRGAAQPGEIPVWTQEKHLPDKSISSPSHTHNNHHEITEDFTIASILIIAYLTETVVQAFLIFDCYRSSYLLVTTNWLWIFLASWLLTSILVTIISMIWTQRGMDFSGRTCGRLLCYFMHCVLLGLLWRYLKIALAYDKADVVEFFKLRTLQIYVQVLPLVIIHLVFFISPVQGVVQSTVSWMIVGEILSASISLVLYSLSKPKLDFICENSNPKEQDDDYARPLTIQANVTSRILLLISRVLTLALFVSSTSTSWVLLATLCHLVLCQTWIFALNKVLSVRRRTTSKWSNCQNEKKHLETELSSQQSHNVVDEAASSSPPIPSSPSVKMSITRMVMCAYVLFWDVNSTILNDINLLSLSLPILLVLVENVTIVVYHLTHENHNSTILLIALASGSCLGLGLIILLAVTTWNKWLILHPCQRREHYLQTETIINKNKGCPTVVALHPHLNMNEDSGVEQSSSGDSSSDLSNKKTNHGKTKTKRPSSSAEGVVAEMIPRVINEVTFPDKCSTGRSHKSGKNTESLEGTNISSKLRAILVSNDYERINETLMTTASKLRGKYNTTTNNSHHHQSLIVDPEQILLTPAKCPGAINIISEAVQMYSEEKVIPRLYENTLSSNSSRNTNTVSDVDDSQVVLLDCKPSYQSTPIPPASGNIKASSYEVSSHKSPLEIRRASKIILNNNGSKQQHQQQQNCGGLVVGRSETSSKSGVNRCCACSGDSSGRRIGGGGGELVTRMHDECGRESDNNIYEKLIEDAYGILIYEGDPTQRTERCVKGDKTNSTSIFYTRKKLRVLCAKCLGNHDPLLSNCLEQKNSTTAPATSALTNLNLVEPKVALLKNPPSACHGLVRPSQQQSSVLFVPTQIQSSPRVPPSETTEYPTDTEFTYNNVPEGDELSISTHLSTVHSTTYANLPVKCYFSHILAPINNVSSCTSSNPKEFTGTEYVKAWLMMNNHSLIDSQSEQEESVHELCQELSYARKYHPSKFNTPASRSSYSNSSKIRKLNNHPYCVRNTNKYTTNPRGHHNHNPQLNIKPVSLATTMTYQPPPKEKQHPLSALRSDSNCPTTPHNNNTRYSLSNKSPCQDKVFNSSSDYNLCLPHSCKLKELNLHRDLLETIV